VALPGRKVSFQAITLMISACDNRAISRLAPLGCLILTMSAVSSRSRKHFLSGFVEGFHQWACLGPWTMGAIKECGK